MPNEFSTAAQQIADENKRLDQEANANPFKAAASQVAGSQRQVLKVSMELAKTANPDTRARAVELAKVANLPVDLVENNLDEVASSFRKTYDPDALRQSHPQLADWLSHPDRAAISNDDVDSLRQIDVSARAISGEDPTGILPPGYLFDGDTIISPIGDGSQAEVFKDLRELSDHLSARGDRDLAREIQSTMNAEDYDREWGWVGNLMAGAAQSIQSTQRAIGTRTEYDRAGDEIIDASMVNAPGWFGDVQRGVGGLIADAPLMIAGGPIAKGVDSLVRMTRARAAVAQVVGRTVARRTTTAVQVAGAVQPLAIREGLNEGQDNGAVDGALAWLVETAVPGAFGRTGLERAIIPGSDVAAQGWRGAVKSLLTDAGMEATEEAVTEWAHAVREVATGADPTALDPDKLFRRLTVAATVGGVAGGTFNLPATIADKFAQDGEEARRAEVHAERLERMVDQLAESKTNERSPAEVKALLETTLGQSSADTFIDAEQFRAVFDDPAAAAATLGVSQEYATALAMGGQLQVSTATLLQTAAKDESLRKLIAHARRKPTATTATEGEEFTARAPDALKALQNEARAQTTTNEADPLTAEAAEFETETFKQADAAAPQTVDRGALRDSVRTLTAGVKQLAKREGKTIAEIVKVRVRGEIQRALKGEKFDLLDAMIERVRKQEIPTAEEASQSEQGRDLLESLDTLAEAIRAAGADVSMSNKQIRAKLAEYEERQTEAAQGAAVVDAPKSGRLDLEALLKQWRKATGDRTPIGGDAAWAQLVQETEKASQASLAREGAGVYHLEDGRPGDIPSGQAPQGDRGQPQGNRVDSPRRAYDVPGQQTFLTPEGEVERELARGDTKPLDDEALVKIFNGHGGSIGPGDRLTRLLADYVEDRIPNVLPLAGAVVNTPRDAAALLATFRSPFAERTTWLLIGADGIVKRNGLWAVGTIDSATIAQGGELRSLLDSIGMVAGDRMVWSHNHPSGNPAPSKADRAVYSRIAAEVEERGATFDGLVLNGDTFYHGVGLGNGEGERGSYDGGKSFFRADLGVALTSPEDIAGWIKSLSVAPGSTIAIHVSPHMRVVGVEAWQVAPDFETIEKSRETSAAARSFVVTEDGSRYKTTQGPARIIDVIETTKAGEFRSLRRGRHYKPGAESDQDSTLRIVREGEAELEQPGKKDRRASIQFPKERRLGRLFNINLFRTADETSFIHENGHLFLELFADLAAAPGASDAIKADHAAILKWLGAKDSASITEEQHETFARGFERYLMEGVAPQSNLRRAFARIKSWMVAIYKSVGNLRVELTPEIRDVFDRLVAAEEATDAVEAEHNMDALLPRESFPSDEEWNAYATAVDTSRQATQDRMEGDLLADLSEDRRQALAAERVNVRADVAAEVDKRPVYQVIAMLQRGELPDGTKLPDEMQGAKLDRADLVNTWGEAVLKKLPGPGRKANGGPYVYANENGQPVEQIARAWGFPSGDAMIEQMIAAPDRDTTIEAETDAEMKRRHPDPMADLPEKARASLMTDHRAELFRRELNALGRRAGQTPAPMEVLRQVARDQVSKIVAYKLAPDKHRIAAAKAARRVVDAAARQQWAEAYRAKTQEALAMELYRATRDAKEASESGRSYLRTFDTIAKRERIGKAGGWEWTVYAPDGSEVGSYAKEEEARDAWTAQPQGATYRRTNGYLEQIDAVLDGFKLRRASTLSLRRRDAFKAWIERQQNDGEPVDIDPQVVADLGNRNWSDLSVAEQSEVVNAVRNIEKLANLKNKLLKSSRSRELDEARAAVVGSIVTNQPNVRPDGQFDDLLSKATGKMVGFIESHRKDSFLARRMDGGEDGGAVWDYLIRSRNEAAGEQETRSAAESAKLSALFKEWKKKTGAFLADIPGTRLRMTLEQRIALALNWGNQQGRQRVMSWLGRGGWNAGDAQAVLDSLDAADWKLVNGIIGQINAHWSDVAALEQRTKGIAPEKVEAVPFVTKAGVQPGGYYPIKYDPAKSTKAGNLAEMALAKEMQKAAGANAQTRRGHTKLRAMNVDDLALRFDFGVIGEHLSEVIHDLTHRELTLDQNRLLRDPEISQAIIGRYGRGALDQFVRTATDIATGDQPARYAIERFAKALRINNSAATFGLNLTSALMNLTGFLPALTRVGPAYMAQGVARLFSGDINNGFQFAAAKSDTMRNRSQTLMREVADATRQVQPGSGIATVRNAGWYFMTQVQRVVDTTVWLGAYEQALKKAEAEGRSGPDADKEAVAVADQTVVDTQGSGRIGDLSGIERGGELAKIFTTFYSYFGVMANLQGSAIGRVYRDPANAGKWMRLVTDTALIWTLPALLTSLIKSALQGDERDDEEWLKSLAREQVSYGMGMLIGLREASGLVEGHFGYSGPAGTRGVAALAKGIGEVFDGDLGKGDAKALSSLVGVFTGLPAVQVNRLIDAIAEDFAKGRDAEGVRRALFGAPRQ
jgi:proteasome lid subunit RPN8/RPN11